MDTAQGKAARLALVWRMGGGQGTTEVESEEYSL